jgi:hypothetical protein
MNNEILNFNQARLDLDSLSVYITSTINYIEHNYNVAKTGDGLDECLMYLKSGPELIENIQKFLVQCEVHNSTNN